MAALDRLEGQEPLNTLVLTMAPREPGMQQPLTSQWSQGNLGSKGQNLELCWQHLIATTTALTGRAGGFQQHRKEGERSEPDVS